MDVERLQLQKLMVWHMQSVPCHSRTGVSGNCATCYFRVLIVFRDCGTVQGARASGGAGCTKGHLCRTEMRLVRQDAVPIVTLLAKSCEHSIWKACNAQQLSCAAHD